MLTFRVLLLLVALGLFIGQAKAADVTFAWDGVTNAAGYKLHCGSKSKTYDLPTVDAKKVTQFTYTGLPNGIDSFCAATAYDAGGVESDFSNEVVVHPKLPAPGNFRSVVVIAKADGSVIVLVNAAPDTVNLYWSGDNNAPQ